MYCFILVNNSFFNEKGIEIIKNEVTIKIWIDTAWHQLIPSNGYSVSFIEVLKD